MAGNDLDPAPMARGIGDGVGVAVVDRARSALGPSGGDA